MRQRAERARDLHVNVQGAASKSLVEDLFPRPAVGYHRDERILMHTSLQFVAARSNAAARSLSNQLMASISLMISASHPWWRQPPGRAELGLRSVSEAGGRNQRN